MRYRHLLLGLPLVWTACLSNNTTSGGGEDASVDLDGGMTPSSDDAGTDASTPIDSSAPALDASGDATVIDAADASPPMLTVVVGGAAGPEQGVSVVWGDATGAVLATTATGPGGIATSALSNAATVTVVLGTPLTPSLYTVMGVQLGQTLFVADVHGLVNSALSVNVASVPAAPTLDGGGSLTYAASAGACTGSFTAPPAPLQLDNASDGQPCVGASLSNGAYAAQVPVLIEAQDANGDPLAYSYVTSDPVANASDAGVLTVTPPSTWSTTLLAQTLTVSESDAGVIPQIAYSELADGVLTPLMQHSASGDDAGPGGEAALVYTHPGFAEAVQAEAFFRSSEDFGAAGTTIVTAALPPTAAGQLTLDPSPVGTAPTFTSVSVALSAQPVVSWTLNSGTLSASTGVIAVTNWYGELEDGGLQEGSWTILSPGTAGTSLTAPALPAALQAYAPVTSSGENNTMVFAIDGQTAIPGYASLLSVGSLYQVYTDVCNVFTPSVPPLPGLGSAVISFFSDGDGC